jgi:hypothetical protein
MMNCLVEAFGDTDEHAVEKMMLSPDVLQAMNHFFTAGGPSKIIIAISVEAELTQNSASRKPKISAPSDGRKLKVYFDEVDQLPNTAVYFMKTKRGIKDSETSVIDSSKANDGALSFGVIHGALESLDALMRFVYRPMIQEMDMDTWGEASSEQRNEFMLSIDVF